MNSHFRESLWHFESSDAEVRRRWESAVRDGTDTIPASNGQAALANLPYHLLTVFTQLRHSRRSFVDPLELINKLGISHTDQQDAHEFRTYLMQSLEDALSSSTYPPHRTLLQALFEGESTSVLRCMECLNESRTRLPFVDLGVPIKGTGCVYVGLQSLVQQEMLEENAVYCSHCRVKRSMVKHVEYGQLPPYVNVQLMRFELVFHGNAARKKKIGDKIYIPEKINLSHCLNPPRPPLSRPSHQPPSPTSAAPSSTSPVSMEVERGTGAAIANGASSFHALPDAQPPPPASFSPQITVSDDEIDGATAEQSPVDVAPDTASVSASAGVIPKKKRKPARLTVKKRDRKPSALEKHQQQQQPQQEAPIVVEEDNSNAPLPASTNGKSRSKKAGSKKKGGGKAAASDDVIEIAAPPSSAAAGPPPPSVYSAAADDSDYHLMAVLLHKGQYANHGHYTATLRDDSGCWWSFDDRIVKRLGDSYHQKGEVVLDAQQTRDSDAKDGAQQQTSAQGSTEQARAVQDEVRADQSMVDVSPPQVGMVIESAAPAEAGLGRHRRTRAPPKSSAPPEPPAATPATEEEPQVAAFSTKDSKGRRATKDSKERRAAKAKKAAASPSAEKVKSKRARGDDASVDPRTQKEAERVYGPGAFSKDAYMLLYARKSHPKLRELEQQHAAALKQESAAVVNGTLPHAPTFSLLEANWPAASAFLARRRSEQVERENSEFEVQKSVYGEKRRQVMEAVERRRAEVESVVPLLQAEAIDVAVLHERLQRRSAEESEEELEGDRPSRFISADWLSTFLTGWTVEEKQKDIVKADAQPKEAGGSSPKDEIIVEEGDKESVMFNNDAASAINVSSDSDEGSADADGSARSTSSPVKAEAVGDDEAEVKSTEEPIDDKAHIVIDHDVHVSVAGMDEALRTAMRHLEPGQLSEAIERIRCRAHPTKVSPHILAQVKRITKAGWDRLTQILGASLPAGDGGAGAESAASATSALSEDADVIPSSQLDELNGSVDALSLNDLCLVCARELFLGDLQRKKVAESERQLLADYLEYRAAHRSHEKSGGKPAEQQPLPDDAVWLDKVWVKAWKSHVQAVVQSSKAAKDVAQQTALQERQRKLMDKPPQGDLTSALLCADHGELDPDTASRRTFVSRALWSRLVHAGSLDSPMLSVHAPECDTCRRTGQTEDAEHKALMAAMKEERFALRHWTSHIFTFPHPEHPPEPNNTRHPEYYLVPVAFHTQVMTFLRALDQSTPRPQLDLRPLRCEHGLLQYMPRPEWEVGPEGLRGAPVGLMVWCDETVWASLRKFGYVEADESGIRMTCKRVSSFPQLALHTINTWAALAVETDPTVCVECAGKRQRTEEADRLRFSREDGGGIAVVTVSSEEEARNSAPITSSMHSAPFHSSPLLSAAAGGTAPSGGALSSAASRPRRTMGRRGGTASAFQQVLCSSSDQVSSIKMELMQSGLVDVEPSRQQLWWKGQKMDNHKTLDDYAVVRGGEIRLLVVDADAADDYELTAGDAEPSKKGKSSGGERGFQGTALGWHARQLVQSGQAASASAGTAVGDGGMPRPETPPASAQHVNLISPMQRTALAPAENVAGKNS